MYNQFPDIIIDASEFTFCPGPCKHNKYKDNIVKLKNRIIYDFKPNFGGRYNYFEYPINFKDNIYLKFKNLRICRKCYNRYNELWNNKDYLFLEKDAENILKKLYNNELTVNLVEF
jgi:hypothetical protein